MKKYLILTLCAAGAAAFAQQESSVEQILNELSQHNSSVSSVTAPAPAKPVVNAPVPEAGIPDPSIQPLREDQVQAAVDDSIGLYAAGEYKQARNGFERILLAHPENATARYFLDKISRKERRNTEEQAIAAVDQAWNGMVLRDYAVSDALAVKLKLDGVPAQTDVTSFFPSVDFSGDAYAVYRPALKKIVVFNDRAGIEKIDSILAALETPVSGKEGQVEIKTRFVEFSEGALEELGFRWSDVEDGQTAGSAGNWSVKDGETLFSNALRSGSEVFPDSIGTQAGATGDWTASRLTDNFTDAGELKLIGDIGPNIEAVIRALEQTSGADVLSAPSVVTKAGQKASIQVGQTHYFPGTFGVGGDAGVIVHIEYQDFSERLMGVDLSVNPKLTGDGLIEMDLNPKVTDLLGWRNYQIAPADSAYTYFQYRVGNTYKHDPIVAKLPIFRHREVKTKVTVANGGTIGMGGLISEKTESFSDRVPVLGSIPLIGRLFRSEGERSVKRNLMIFVTASKVSPNGRILSETVSK